jgi:hypothetical protein
MKKLKITDISEDTILISDSTEPRFNGTYKRVDIDTDDKSESEKDA